MRNGWREATWLRIIALIGVAAIVPRPTTAAAPRGVDPVVRLTVEVRWETPSPREPSAIEISASAGRIVEIRPWPAQDGGPEPPMAQAEAAGTWKVGSSRSGRVRLRVEAPIGASILVRHDGRTTGFPILGLLDSPEQATDPVGPEVVVERIAWDSVEIHLEGDGTAAPGSILAAGVGFNVLAPEAGEVAVRFSAEVRPARGGAPVWRSDRAEVALADATNTTVFPLEIPAPEAEGTYVLEIRANWELLANADRSRLSRLIHKKKLIGPTSATRRVTFAVVGPVSAPKKEAAGSDTVVESIRANRVRGSRPSATGRAPLSRPEAPWDVPEAVLVEAQRRDRLRSWATRSSSEGTLGAVDASGLAWSAIGLKIPHPGRPHRLSVSVIGGKPTALGVALVVPKGPSGRPRVLLDACASGPAVAEGSEPQTFTWPVWPDASEPILVLVNRGLGPVKLGSIELTEMAAEPTPATLAETHPDAPRRLALDLSAPGALDRFGGIGDGGIIDSMAMGRNLASYLLFCGASTAVLPDDLADRPRRRSLDGQGEEDAIGPDRLDLTLRLLARQGLSALVSLPIDGPLPGLPAADSPESLARGLVRVARDGKADGPSYQPLRKEVRAAMVRLAVEAIAPRKARSNLAGVLVRLGPGASLPGGPDVGFDDETYARFARETFGPEGARDKPGLGTTDPGRFAARQKYLAGPGRLPWLSWRAQQVGDLYAEIAASVRKAAPGAVLVVATPDLDDGPAGEEARRGDQVGASPKLAWRAVGLDLGAWPDRPGLVVLRSVGLSTDDLGHDLSVSPELDEPVAARAGRGVLVLGGEAARDAVGPSLAALPMADGPAGDEPLGHAVAALDARWAVVSASAAAGREERLRRFARVFRALPDLPETARQSARTTSGAALRSWSTGGKSYLAMANDTPYTVVVETTLAAPSSAIVEDLGRVRSLDARPVDGGRKLVVELAPFGLAAIRIGRADVPAGAYSTYLVGKRDLDARAEALSALLDRPATIATPIGPPNAACEPPASNEVRVASGATGPPGWSASEPGGSAAIDADRPRSGRGSLRLDARSPLASVVGEPFAPPSGAPLSMRFWLRSSPPGVPVRAWVEGDSAGRPASRCATVEARGDWSEFAIRLADLPSGGLDRCRIRFEPMAAGRIWVDDVALVGPDGPETDRRSRRALTAAVHAYREGRYADFARLAGSSWARRIGPGPVPDPEPNVAPPLPGDPPGTIRTGAAPGLSPDRRIR